MNNELKVSFYLKRERTTERTKVNPDAIYPVIGKIIIGNSIVQFSSKKQAKEVLGRKYRHRDAVVERKDRIIDSLLPYKQQLKAMTAGNEKEFAKTRADSLSIRN